MRDVVHHLIFIHIYATAMSTTVVFVDDIWNVVSTRDPFASRV